MLRQPLVTIICLCYNHEKYVEEAILSAVNQDYRHTELIVVDDASSDNSREVISRLADRFSFKVIINDKNLGNCQSFNNAYRQSKGKYLIDLAADDLLLPSRVSEGVKSFEEHGEPYGVNYCNVMYLDEKGMTTGTHFKKEPGLSGDLYKVLLERYYLPTPSIMIDRKVLETLGGYDATLRYEDFDFFVRSSRQFYYVYTDTVLVGKRILPKSLSKKQFKRKNSHQLSTAMVCEKALMLNKDEEEHKALANRVIYELKWSLITENWDVAKRFIAILRKLHKKPLHMLIARGIMWIRPKWHGVFKSK